MEVEVQAELESKIFFTATLLGVCAERKVG